MDEAEREGAGSLEPLAIGGSEVSTLPLSLHECDIDDFAKIAARLLLGEIRLKALIAASDRAYYFLPVTEFKQDSEVIELFEKGIYAKTPSDSDKMNEYRAESGTYEILDIESVARNLDEIFAQRLSDEEVRIEVRLSLSPKGIRGQLVELAAGHGRTVIIHFPSIYCNRILIEEVKAEATKTNLIKSLMLRYLDDTNGQGDFHGCIQFLLGNGVEKDDDESHFIWRSIGGEYQKNKKKTMQNLFSERKKEWKQQ